MKSGGGTIKKCVKSRGSFILYAFLKNVRSVLGNMLKEPEDFIGNWEWKQTKKRLVWAFFVFNICDLRIHR